MPATVPLVTTRPAALSPLTLWLKVMVKGMGVAAVVAGVAAATATVGGPPPALSVSQAWPMRWPRVSMEAVSKCSGGLSRGESVRSSVLTIMVWATVLATCCCAVRTAAMSAAPA